MTKKKQNVEVVDEQLAQVEQALSSSELFIEKNQKPILYTVCTVVLVVLAVLAFRNFYLAPKEVNAANEIYKAQLYYEKDSFQLALTGDAFDCIGFEGVITEYGMTKSGKLATAYAGICAYKLGKYEEAISYLKKYNGKDLNIAPATTQLLGDAYIEIGEVKKAISCYNEVASLKNNIFSPMSLKKAGIAHQSLGNKKEAEKAYTAIKENYPQSTEAVDIDKYIANIK